jgi:hypothetical protein
MGLVSEVAEFNPTAGVLLIATAPSLLHKLKNNRSGTRIAHARGTAPAKDWLDARC